MADKEKPVKIKDEMYSISADDVIKISKNRPIIPLTLSFDIATSGGVPFGSCVIVAGKAKTGKTSTTLQLGANAQNMFDSKIFFFPVEGRLTTLVLKQIKGLKTSKDYFEVVLPPPIYDKNGDLIGHKKVSAEFWWEQIGDCILKNTRCIIVVDSVSNMSSEKEQSEDMGYQDRGGRNKLEAEFCRKYGQYIAANEHIVFFLAQVQANTSGYGPPIQAKVGNAIRHQADLIIFGKNVEKWPESNGRILGHDILYKVEASALGSPDISMNVPLRYGYGIDTTKDLVNHLIQFDIIKRNGAWYTLPYINGENPVYKEIPEEVETPKIKKGKKAESKTEEGNIAIAVEEEKFILCNGEGQIRNWLLLHPEQEKFLDKLMRDRVMI